MTNLEVKQIYQRLDKEVNYLSKSALIIHKEACKKDSHMILSILKENLDVWIIQLGEKEISFSQLELLVFDEKEYLDMGMLKSIGVSEKEINLFKHCLLRLIVNTIINCMWEKQFLYKKVYN